MALSENKITAEKHFIFICLIICCLAHGFTHTDAAITNRGKSKSFLKCYFSSIFG